MTRTSERRTFQRVRLEPSDDPREPATLRRYPRRGSGTVRDQSWLVGRGSPKVRVHIKRIARGPSLVIEHADRLVAEFLRWDPSAQPGGFDDLAGKGEPYRITATDVIAINTTMRARSPHAAWPMLNSPDELAWLRGARVPAEG